MTEANVKITDEARERAARTFYDRLDHYALDPDWDKMPQGDRIWYRDMVDAILAAALGKQEYGA